MRTVADRFWSKVDKSGPVMRPELGPCWVWLSAKDKDGYGKFQINLTRPRRQQHVRAHRLAFLLSRGVAPGAHVLHRCDNSSCVNPDHLESGSQLKNIRDCVARGRYKNPRLKGSAHPRAKSTEREVLEWRKRREQGESVASIARSAGRSSSVVSHATIGRTWGHV